MTAACEPAANLAARAVTLVALALLTASPAAAQQAATPEATVQAFHAALAAGDSSGALALLAPEVTVFESGGAETLAEYRSHHLATDMEFARGTIREIMHQQSGMAGDVAWVLSATRTTGSFRGRDLDSRGVETMVLTRTPGGWRIVHVHWSARR